MEEIRDGYELSPFLKDINLNALISVHYFEYPSTFLFEGEAHDFWEFLYVDKGEVEVFSASARHVLKQGQIIFHKPMEFHNVVCNGRISPNLVVVAFDSPSPAMDFFSSRILSLGNREKRLLNTIVSEARRCFSNRLENPYYKGLKVSSEAPFGSFDMIKSALTMLLVLLIREGDKPDKKPPPSPRKVKEDSRKIQEILAFLQEHVGDNLSLDQIAHDCIIGRSVLQKLFKSETGWSVMEYYCRLKIDEAKRMIREGDMNYSGIADELGYASIHYFSRQFKKISGMSPSEYSKSMKDLLNQPRPEDLF